MLPIKQKIEIVAPLHTTALQKIVCPRFYRKSKRLQIEINFLEIKMYFNFQHFALTLNLRIKAIGMSVLVYSFLNGLSTILQKKCN